MIVILYSSCWFVSPGNYKLLLEAIANYKPFKMEDYGSLLTNKVTDISQMKPEEAKQLYETS